MTVSRYGRTFDDLVDRWSALEREHDVIHPDRADCGGVGGCTLMARAFDLRQEMGERLEEWRKPSRKYPEHVHRASCHGAIGELLCLWDGQR